MYIQEIKKKKKKLPWSRLYLNISYLKKGKYFGVRDTGLSVCDWCIQCINNIQSGFHSLTCYTSTSVIIMCPLLEIWASSLFYPLHRAVTCTCFPTDTERSEGNLHYSIHVLACVHLYTFELKVFNIHLQLWKKKKKKIQDVTS